MCYMRFKDAVAVYDTLWDKTFADSQDILDKLADEAHEEFVAGLIKLSFGR